MIDDTSAYTALKSRDPRFDGVFFVGVTSTGVYCRPVCPARTPKRENCRFFPSAETAEKARFRPCLRCRPELAPGCAPVDRAQRIARLMVRWINEDPPDDGGTGLEETAARFGVSSRQLRRILRQELGVSPLELVGTRRLLLAKQLLTETRLPVTEIAFASGFSSLRRFNDAFLLRYRMPPTGLRRAAAGRERGVHSSEEASTLLLTYRPPYDWEAILEFLKRRMILEVERVTGESYAQTVRLGACRGWILVTHAPVKSALRVEFAHSLTPVLPALLGRLRRLFDLEARPDLIAEHLMKDGILRESVLKNPGLRVPGAFDGFEMAVRAVLGQQITVRAATTLACRYAAAFGEECATPIPGLTRLTPSARKVARAGVDDIARLGITGARAACVLGLARVFSSGSPVFSGADPEMAVESLTALPGVGPWTAHYIAMRALGWPDAFPQGDVVVKKRLGGVDAKRAEALSQAWRPWRSYAVMHLWRLQRQEAE